jgi:hypothetical protein
MPPPNGFPNGGVAGDPRVQELISEIGNMMGARLAAHLQQVNATITPAGRPVDVFRRDENNKPVTQTTTTPQMLAELNDNMDDLNDNVCDLIDAIDALRKGGAREQRTRRRRRG